MKNYKNLKGYIAIVVLSLFAWSCMEETAITFDGMQVEWEGAINGSGTAYLRQNDGQGVIDSLRVNLIGPQQSSPVTVNVAINSDLTTAVQGLHYNPISTGSITIPANSSFGYYIFEVLDDNINPGENLTLAVDMTGGEIEVSENYSTVEHTIQVSCPSALAGVINYTYESLYSPFYGDVAPPADGSIELTDGDAVGEYTISDASLGGLVYLYAQFDAEPATLTMTDICSVISFTGVDVYGDRYKWEVLDNDGTNLRIRWTNTYDDTGVAVLTREDGGSWPLDLEGSDFN